MRSVVSVFDQISMPLTMQREPESMTAENNEVLIPSASLSDISLFFDSQKKQEIATMNEVWI